MITDLITNPAYSFYSGNIFNNANEHIDSNVSAVTMNANVLPYIMLTIFSIIFIVIGIVVYIEQRN